MRQRQSSGDASSRTSPPDRGTSRVETLQTTNSALHFCGSRYPALRAPRRPTPRSDGLRAGAHEPPVALVVIAPASARVTGAALNLAARRAQNQNMMTINVDAKKKEPEPAANDSLRASATLVQHGFLAPRATRTKPC